MKWYDDETVRRDLQVSTEAFAGLSAQCGSEHFIPPSDHPSFVHMKAMVNWADSPWAVIKTHSGAICCQSHQHVVKSVERYINRLISYVNFYELRLFAIYLKGHSV